MREKPFEILPNFQSGTSYIDLPWCRITQLADLATATILRIIYMCAKRGERERIIHESHAQKPRKIKMFLFFWTIIKNKAIDFAIDREFDIQWTFDWELIFLKQTLDATVWKYTSFVDVYVVLMLFCDKLYCFSFFRSFVHSRRRCRHCCCNCCCCWFLFDCFVYGTFWSCAAILVVSRSHSPYSIAVTLFLVSSENVFLTK